MSHHAHASSLFHRRLLLIGGVIAVVFVVLAGQLMVLAAAQGDEHLARAERALRRWELLPTYRAPILDRHGRQLAVDRPGYAIAVHYPVITGEWPLRQARLVASRELGRGVWLEMTEAQRVAAAQARRGEFDARCERLWDAICAAGEFDRAELEDRRTRTVRSVEQIAEDVWDRQRRQLEKTYGAEEGLDAFSPQEIAEHRSAHVMLPSVSDEVAFSFRSLANELPDMFEVQDARRREYPWLTAVVPLDRASLPKHLASMKPIDVRVDGVADHILGTLRPVYGEDVERRPLRGPDGALDPGGYDVVDDFVGASGIERVYEDVLRGTRGQRRLRLDTDAEERVDPRPGRPVQLTIDILLQARVQAILSDEIGLATVQPWHQNPGDLPLGWPLNSAAVVLEIETGEILAMVSMPTRQLGRDVAAIDTGRARIDWPFINRPVAAVYPPGSIIKPLVLAAAVQEGVHDIDDPITCTGKYWPHAERPRCWIYRDRWDYQTHGDMHASDAISHSCNIYFYTLAERLGMLGLSRWYREFGLGEPLDVGLRIAGDDADPGEVGGTLPTQKSVDDAIDVGELPFRTVTLGIGQGRVTWTPIQAANAYAMLARGGSVRDATIVIDDPHATRPRRTRDIDMDPRTVDAILTGLRGTVEEGSGHQIAYQDGSAPDVIFNAEGVTVWGKTGTAQAPPLRLEDTNDDGVIDGKDDGITGLDHAWFVGFVGPNDTARPMFVVAVIVEYGGSGGRVAAPVANQIIHALQEEGYLPEPWEG